MDKLSCILSVIFLVWVDTVTMSCYNVLIIYTILVKNYFIVYKGIKSGHGRLCVHTFIRRHIRTNTHPTCTLKIPIIEIVHPDTNLPSVVKNESSNLMNFQNQISME